MIPVDGPAGVMTTACRKRKPRQHGRPPSVKGASSTGNPRGVCLADGGVGEAHSTVEAANHGRGKGP